MPKLCRCLETGSMYDMPAMFRLVQLWLNLAAERDINHRMEQALDTVPSHKFLSLVYQMASRMTSSQSGSLFQSGFQVVSPSFCIDMHKQPFERYCYVLSSVPLLAYLILQDAEPYCALQTY